MTAKHDLSGFGDILADVYAKPDTETVKLAPPAPTTVEVEEEYLTTLPDGTKIRKSGVVKVTVGQDDYPQKTVSVRGVKEKTETHTGTEDRGPTSAYKTVSIALWCVSAVLGIVFLSTNAVLVVFPLLLAIVAFPLRSYIKSSSRVVAQVERKSITYQEFTKTVTIPVDPKYAPRTEERPLSNESRITAVGTLTIPFDAVAFGSGVLLIDSLQLSKPPSVQIPTLQDPVSVQERIDQLDEALKKLPPILSGEHGRATNVEDPDYPDGVPIVGLELEILRGFEDLIESVHLSKLQRFLPNVIEPGSPLLRFLRHIPGLSPSEADFNKDLARMRQVVPAEAQWDSKRVLEGFVEAWNRHHLAMTKLRFSSLGEQISPHVLSLGNLSHYSSYNFYCPECIRELREAMLARDYSVLAGTETQPVMFPRNSRCVFDPETSKWRCRACESQFNGQELVPIHKVLDDVLYPSYDRLMEENKITRLEMDNKTRDDVLTYENKRSQEIDAIRMTHERDSSSAQNSIEMARAEVNGQRQSIEAIMGIMRTYELKQTEVVKSIDHRCDQIQHEIGQIVESRRAIADEKLAKLLETFRGNMTVVGKMKREEDLIRDQIQVGIFKELQQHTQQNREKIALHAQSLESSKRMESQLHGIHGAVQDGTAVQKQLLGQSRALHESVQEGNAIQAARAQKDGVDIYDAGWFRIDKNIPKFAANVVSGIAGSTTADRNKRIQQYLGSN